MPPIATRRPAGPWLAAAVLAASSCQLQRPAVFAENPSPTRALPIRIRAIDAPVAVPVPKIFVRYDIDARCVPHALPGNSGSAKTAVFWLQFRAHRISSTAFSSVVFEDGMADIAHADAGQCRWTLGIVQAAFPFVSGQRLIHASASASLRELTSPEPSITYVRTALPPLSGHHRPAWTNTWPAAAFLRRPDFQREAFFTIEISRNDEARQKPAPTQLP